MLVQTLNAISMRFQNRSAPGRATRSRRSTLDPLRPLNNLIWGYVQDEQHRLTLTRRAYEYDHQYGLTLYGRAVPPLRSADQPVAVPRGVPHPAPPHRDLLQGGRRHDDASPTRSRC